MLNRPQTKCFYRQLQL